MNKFDFTVIPGLSDAEAAERLRQEGYNELPASGRRGILLIAWDVVREPMFLLLVACGMFYLLLGDLEEALVLLASVFLVMGITLYQEGKTERALEALRDLSSPRALVVRGGRQQRVAGREVVRGDALVLAEGDRVSADAVLLSSTNLSADESLLTGESVPVRKRAAREGDDSGRPGGDDLPFIFSGTLVVQGQGVARVTVTGPHTEMGKIGRALAAIDLEGTRLQRETGRLVRLLAGAGLSLCVLVAVVYGLTREGWTDGVLAGITMAMAMMPEEIPVV